MGASVTINGTTARRLQVPFGAAVTLHNSAPNTGASLKWEILAPIDANGNPPDYATNFGAWTVNGDGTVSITQSSPFSDVTFTPDVSGNYMGRLTNGPDPVPMYRRSL
jgi:hypothetical protein